MSTQFTEMAIAVHRDGTLDETVERVLEFALSAVQCRFAAVVLVGGQGRLETLAATDPILSDLDTFQHEVGEGPDLAMLDDRVSVLVSDTRVDTRWPLWAARAADLGLRSMLGVRLYTETATVGTLNLYDPSSDHFDVDDQATAHVFARHAAAALARSRQVENLRSAIDARKRIGQAQGLLMERYGLDEDQAFQVLIRYSQDNNLKLRVVAEELIRTRALPAES